MFGLQDTRAAQVRRAHLWACVLRTGRRSSATLFDGSHLAAVALSQVKPKKKKKTSKVAVDKPITQDEMLLEAAFTEIHNTRYSQCHRASPIRLLLTLLLEPAHSYLSAVLHRKFSSLC